MNLLDEFGLQSAVEPITAERPVCVLPSKREKKSAAEHGVGCACLPSPAAFGWGVPPAT